MKVYLVRHGRTNYNDLGLCNADPTVDVHLTKVGIGQAEALAEKLKSEHFDYLLISELKRTRQTADIINKFHGLKLEVNPLLNDGNSGFEGKPSAEYNRALDAADNPLTVRFNGGESIEDVKERAARFVDDLRRKNYDSVLIVTSEWIIQAILAVIHQLSDEEAWSHPIEQGSCTVIEI